MEKEIFLRFGFFAGAFLMFALIESIYPKRKLRIYKSIRWARNLSMLFISHAVTKFVLPFTAVGVAIYGSQNQLGLFNNLPVNFSVSVVLSILILDLVIYSQHVLFHHVPFLWRFHKIHHMDQEIDVTTGVRFHPIEILLSALIKCAIILFFGMSVIAVLIFEILLNAASMFNHSNLRLPLKIDKYLRMIIITPDMHRVHHSVVVSETNSNFGFNLPWWDRIFHTYKPQPQKGHSNMGIGLKEYKDYKTTSFIKSLIIPFYNKENKGDMR